MKTTIAEVKRKLSVGTEFTAEFIGAVNTRIFGNKGVTDLQRPMEEIKTKRRVEKQGAEMASRILTGPKKDNLIYVKWKGIEAYTVDESIVLRNKENQEDFLKITLG